MAADPHVLRPDHHPTPFTADEIRLGCRAGRTVRSLVVEGGAEPYVAVTRFVSVDAEGADTDHWTETPDGRRVTGPERHRSTWLEFQGHASMPAARTEITEETLDIPAGRYDALRYTRHDGDTVSTFWFAMSSPGMPLRFEIRSTTGELLFSSIALENIRPGVPTT